MKPKESRAINRRLVFSKITSTISLALVIYILGLIGFLLMNAYRVSNVLKENISITLILKDNLKDADLNSLKGRIAAMPQIKTVTYISKEEAAEELSSQLGEDFIEFLGYNPLSQSMDVRINAEYAHPDSIASLAGALGKLKGVDQVSYQQNLITSLSDNINKASILFLFFSAMLAIIAIFIINHSVRLSIYSKRFLIKTMQWVGASSSFIRRPFVKESFCLGIFGSLLAAVLMALTIYWAQSQIEGLVTLGEYKLVGALFLSMILTGTAAHMLFTCFSVNKFLRIKEDNLYY